jgi:hypothetical protein
MMAGLTTGVAKSTGSDLQFSIPAHLLPFLQQTLFSFSFFLSFYVQFFSLPPTPHSTSYFVTFLYQNYSYFRHSFILIFFFLISFSLFFVYPTSYYSIKFVLLSLLTSPLNSSHYLQMLYLIIHYIHRYDL